MNTLQNRQAASFATALADPNTKYLERKKSNLLSGIFYVVIGKWRLYWNYCPECNSCAPKIHHCDVCKADTKAYFNWDKKTEQKWWKKYLVKHNIISQ